MTLAYDTLDTDKYGERGAPSHRSNMRWEHARILALLSPIIADAISSGVLEPDTTADMVMESYRSAACGEVVGG